MKERLDAVLLEKGFFPTREKAKAAIMAGIVLVDGERVDKAGTFIPEDAVVTLKEDPCPYVSRGGLKLDKAIASFGLELSGAVSMDIGASTGGFTDCMLQKGAVKVYAVDVGYGQLDYKLRIDPRVVNMEKQNIRFLDTGAIPDPIDFISIDVSFISLKLVLPVASSLLTEDGHLVALVKPQFEAGREQVGKGGIVKDPAVHLEVLEHAVSYGRENGFFCAGLDYSPVKGAKGNIEYLMHLTKKEPAEGPDPAEVVERAHRELDK